MSDLRYSAIFDEYHHGAAELRLLRDAGGPHKPIIRTLAPEVESQVIDWMEGNPHPVIRLKASRHGCIVWLASSLRQHEAEFAALPANHVELRAAQAHCTLVDICRRVYGENAVIHMLPDIDLYCTRSRLRTHPSEHLRATSRENIREIMDFLLREKVMLCDAPSYILDNGPSFAWYDAGKPVGFASVHPSYMQNRVGNIGNVFVLEPYRRRGIATAVVGAVAEALLADNRVPIYGCFVDNLGSAHAAESAGFLFAGCHYRVFVADSR